jgi:hypothetical protein
LEFKEFRAPEPDDTPNDKELAEKLKKFDELHNAPPKAPDIKKDEYRIVRKSGSNQLKIVDGTNQTVFDNFTLEQLKSAKEAFSATDPLKKKDLNDQRFIQFVLVFLGGLLIGAFSTYVILQQKHAKEMASVHMKLDALTAQLAERQKRSINDVLLEEYNKVAGGPVS